MKNIIKIIFLPVAVILLLINFHPISAQELSNAANTSDDTDLEVDFYLLEELLDVEVEVASLFIEDELVIGSTVAGIVPEKWKLMGARRVYEALNNELGVMLYPEFGSSTGISIRGYASEISALRGISLLIDGVPMNGLHTKTAFYQLPDWNLGTLNAIEMIKGPGSAIYGEDAFHGVLYLKTFESGKDHYSIDLSHAYPVYRDGSF